MNLSGSLNPAKKAVHDDFVVARKPLSIRKISDGGRRNLVVFYVLIAILLCTMLLTYVWSFVKMVEIRVVLNKNIAEYKSLLKERDNLLAERARLSATVRIEEIAKKKLHMVLPSRVEYVSLLAGGAESTAENSVEHQ